MTVFDVKKNIEQKMLKSIESFKMDLGKIRTGRAHIGLLDHVHVDYYGSMLPIPQTANVTLLDARTISVQPWEKKMVNVIQKAIRDANLGLNPTAEGTLIRVPMPMLTEERRRELTRVVKQEAEAAKVSIRSLRREANDTLKKIVKDKEASEDAERRASDDVQKLTDKFVAEIEKLTEAKEVELMTL
ncbi:ribosome recycling factor [Candidatus Pandoraea novymonadis]|uniref:Ribosome-recycling factor n=1 Tax=Candidatus Pandoraea novymonadis TaxID=1808959 RepID=A0ABX5FFU6_9BURK|nr:ribosome recycling factor [Candidatus Pandoraea novymonadis]PSB92032.1 Ribosome-recycling factor [Candidatus Pandoraea novymonadis]